MMLGLAFEEQNSYRELLERDLPKRKEWLVQRHKNEQSDNRGGEKIVLAG